MNDSKIVADLYTHSKIIDSCLCAIANQISFLFGQLIWNFKMYLFDSFLFRLQFFIHTVKQGMRCACTCTAHHCFSSMQATYLSEYFIFDWFKINGLFLVEFFFLCESHCGFFLNIAEKIVPNRCDDICIYFETSCYRVMRWISNIQIFFFKIVVGWNSTASKFFFHLDMCRLSPTQVSSKIW